MGHARGSPRRLPHSNLARASHDGEESRLRRRSPLMTKTDRATLPSVPGPHIAPNRPPDRSFPSIARPDRPANSPARQDSVYQSRFVPVHTLLCSSTPAAAPPMELARNPSLPLSPRQLSSTSTLSSPPPHI